MMAWRAVNRRSRGSAAERHNRAPETTREDDGSRAKMPRDTAIRAEVAHPASPGASHPAGPLPSLRSTASAKEIGARLAPPTVTLLSNRVGFMHSRQLLCHVYAVIAFLADAARFDEAKAAV